MVAKSGLKEIKRMLHPHGVVTVDFEGAPVTARTLNNIHSYLLLYALVFCGALLVVSLENLDFHTIGNFPRITAVFKIFLARIITDSSKLRQKLLTGY